MVMPCTNIYSPERPILINLKLKDGRTIHGAKLVLDCISFKGFLAIESQIYSGALEYVAVDHIAAFTVLREETNNMTGCFLA